MKKYGVILLVVLLSVGVMGCSGQNKDDASSTWERIESEGKIVVGLDDTFAPMGYREKGTNDLIGFDIDMGAEMGARLGIEFEWLPTEWKGVTGSLNSKKFDVIINGLSITDDRKEVIDFTIPYVNAGIGAVVLVDSDIDSIEDLGDYRVATQTGSSGAEACEKAGYEDVALYDQYPNAFQDLSIGRIDVVVVDATTAFHFLEKKENEYRMLDGRIEREDYAIGLRKEDELLKEKLNGILIEMMEDGTLAALSEKWFGSDVIAYQE